VEGPAQASKKRATSSGGGSRVGRGEDAAFGPKLLGRGQRGKSLRSLEPEEKKRRGWTGKKEPVSAGFNPVSKKGEGSRKLSLIPLRKKVLKVRHREVLGKKTPSYIKEGKRDVETGEKTLLQKLLVVTGRGKCPENCQSPRNRVGKNGPKAAVWGKGGSQKVSELGGTGCRNRSRKKKKKSKEGAGCLPL